MTILEIHDALVSVRLAADLCGVPIDRVLSMLSSKVIRPVTVQGRQLVSLLAVERAIGGESKPHEPTI
jgi:hypothetical protein